MDPVSVTVKAGEDAPVTLKVRPQGASQPAVKFDLSAKSGRVEQQWQTPVIQWKSAPPKKAAEE